MTARLVAAFGTSHSVALNSPAEDFAGHVQRDEDYVHHLDRDGRPTTYDELVCQAGPSIAEEIKTERIAARVVSGHIAVVVPEIGEHRARRDARGEVTAPLQSQAGATNFRYGNPKAGWWTDAKFAEFAFWVHG